MALHDESEQKSGEAADTANEGAPAEQEGHQIENHWTIEADVIAREVKSAIWELVANEMVTTVEEALDDFLRKTLCNARSGVRSVIYNVVKQSMLDLLCQDIIGETLDAHMAMYFDTDAGAKVFKVANLQLVYGACCHLY